MSTGISAETWTSALASANLAVAGVRALVDEAPSETEQPSTVLALCRPPGHHCDTARAGGYCYVNNAVVAVEAWRQLQLHYPPNPTPTPTPRERSSEPSNAPPPAPLPAPNSKPRPQSPHKSKSAGRIAILDLDFHHGNGTQEAFYADPRVLYVSIHGADEYPYYTGSASETGAGPGEGMNVNLPLESGSSFAEYGHKLRCGLSRIEEEKGLGLLVICLGFDTYKEDPLGGFGIGTGDYESMAEMVARSVDERPRRGSGEEVPVLILLEGGYVIEKLGENMLSFLRGWEETRRM